MKYTTSIVALALGVAASPTRPELAPRATPTVYLCGDSTMANKGANDGKTDGWGQYLKNYTPLTVVNNAIGGRSARSFYDEGRFQSVANNVKSGDIVVIEFGHNDGGSPNSNDNGRSDCPGTGEETCVSSSTGKTVYTFGHYVKAASALFTAKGATVILSSQTPNNLWEGGSYSAGAPRFVGYQKTAQQQINSGSVTFVDHFQATANMYKKLGNSATNAFYPADHTHTSPAGADKNAASFAQAIYTAMNGTTSLKSHIPTNPSVY